MTVSSVVSAEEHAATFVGSSASNRRKSILGDRWKHMLALLGDLTSFET